MIGSELAKAFVTITADTSDADKSISQLEKNAVTKGQNITKTLAQAFGAAAIGAGIKKTIDAASDLNETVSKTEVIFGDASTAIQKQGDTAAKSMGLSKTAYLDAASGLKGLLDNLGLAAADSTKWSQDLVKLGGDLGSFFNKDPADAVYAIGAALRGESEPIRAFNVNINEAALKTKALELGLYDGVGALDSNAKAQASLALIMEQTTAAQGDFARTADGAANSQRIAKAEAENAAASFGQVLLPAYTRVVQVVGAVVKVFGELPAPVQTALIALVGLVAISGPLSNLISIVGGIKTALAGLSASTGGLLLVAAAVAGLAYALTDSDDPHAQVAARSKEVAGNLAKETEEIVKQRQEAGAGATAAQSYADAQKAMSDALTGSDEKGQKLAKALGALGLQTDDAAKLLGLLKTEGNNAVSVFDEASGTFKRFGDANQAAAAAQGDLALEMLMAKGITRDVARVLVEAGQGATFMGDASDNAKQQTKGWTAENKALFESIVEVGRQAGGVDLDLIATGYLNAEVASSKFRESIVAQAEAQTNASRNGEDAARVYDEYLRIMSNLTPAQQAMAEATNESVTAIVDARFAVNDLGLQIDGLATSTEDAAIATERLKVQQDQSKARAAANASATERLSESLEDTASATDLARKAADEFDKALDQVFGTNLDLEEANRALAEGFEELASTVKENGDTLDINTEKGRNNRAAIQDQVTAITDKIKADIASGVSVKDATAAGELYRQKLIDTARQSGLSKEAAEEYINQLGLTPENITTAVQLQHDEEVRGRLQLMVDKLKVIDAGAAAKIQAEVDKGNFDAAERALANLARNRYPQIIPGVIGSGRTGQSAGRESFGSFVRGGSNYFHTTGELPGRAGDEVILPLGNPARIRELWRDNGVGSRITDALGSDGQASYNTSMGSTTGVHIENAHFSSGVDAEAVAQLVLFKLSAAG